MPGGADSVSLFFMQHSTFFQGLVAFLKTSYFTHFLQNLFEKP